MSLVYIASDHAGFHLKNILVEHLNGTEHEPHDLGPSEPVSCDYPDSAEEVVKAVLSHPGSFGILICGTGIGMSMAANRHDGIRAAVVGCEFQARACRAHNNANVLCLGERVIGPGVAMDIADLFLSTPFEGGRHLRRIGKFDPASRVTD